MLFLETAECGSLLSGAKQSEHMMSILNQVYLSQFLSPVQAASLTFKVLHGLGPTYLKDCPLPYVYQLFPLHQLHSLSCHR